MTFDRKVLLPTRNSVPIHQNTSASHCVVTLFKYHLLSKDGVWGAERDSTKDYKGKQIEFITPWFWRRHTAASRNHMGKSTHGAGRESGTETQAHSFIRA